jgi:DNA-binding LacI/PurR family transcriptional regulator
MRALAKRYKVGLVTVREALLFLEREGWVTLRHGSGTYVARVQATDRHVAILVELDILKPGTSPYFLRIVNRLRHYFSERQIPYRIHIGFANGSHKVTGDPTCYGFMDDLENDHVSGVIAVATLPDKRWAEPTKQRNIPIVGMDLQHVFDAVVCMDYSEMLRLGADALIEQGCRKLAFIGGRYRNPKDASILKDYNKSIDRHGLIVYPEWHRTILRVSQPGIGGDSVRELWNARGEKPDGILIADDMLLSDAARAIRELNIQVPAQLKVAVATSREIPHDVGFPLIRIENVPEDVGSKLAELLLTLMAGSKPEEKAVKIGYSLVREG